MTPVKSASRRRGRRPLQREPAARPGAGLHHDAVEDHAVRDHADRDHAVRDHAAQDWSAQDWSAIGVGSTVRVTPSAGMPYFGRVDAKTPDSEIVWVLSLEGSGRQMLGNLDGVSLLPAARWPS